MGWRHRRDSVPLAMFAEHRRKPGDRWGQALNRMFDGVPEWDSSPLATREARCRVPWKPGGDKLSPEG